MPNPKSRENENNRLHNSKEYDKACAYAKSKMELNNATFFADKWTNVASKARWYSNHSAMEPMDPLKSEILVNNVDIALKRLSYQMHQAVLAEVHVMSPSLMEAAEAAQKNLRDVSSQLVWNTLKLQETENENDIMIFVTEKEKEEEICYYYESAEDALEDSRNKHRAEMEAARWKPSRPDEVDVHSAINDNNRDILENVLLGIPDEREIEPDECPQSTASVSDVEHRKSEFNKELEEISCVAEFFSQFCVTDTPRQPKHSGR